MNPVETDDRPGLKIMDLPKEGGLKGPCPFNWKGL